jgi:hypothetical protein
MRQQQHHLGITTNQRSPWIRIAPRGHHELPVVEEEVPNGRRC